MPKKAPITRTVFSIDPTTGEPYITVDHAQKIAYIHLSRHCLNILPGNRDLEDLKQELLLKLCGSQFNPEKSAAKTFVITCFMSATGNIAKKMKAYGRDSEISDFAMKQDGESMLATEAFEHEDWCDPESEMIALELERELDAERMKKSTGKKREMLKRLYFGA